MVFLQNKKKLNYGLAIDWDDAIRPEICFQEPTPVQKRVLKSLKSKNPCKCTIRQKRLYYSIDLNSMVCLKDVLLIEFGLKNMAKFDSTQLKWHPTDLIEYCEQLRCNFKS